MLSTRLRTLAGGAILGISSVLGACAPRMQSAQPATAVTTNPDANHKLQVKLLRRLAKQFEGNFTSAQQATDDPEKEYQDQWLHVRRIWTNRSEAEGLYFYVEQAPAAKPLAPVRQQVVLLRLRAGDDRIEYVPYALRRPKRYVGQWEDKVALTGLTPDSLVATPGCTLAMYQTSGAEDGFRGITEGRDCRERVQNAAYTTTDVTVTATQIIWWERGFDLTDQRVWGPKQGGYVFLRSNKKPKPSEGLTPTKS